MPGRMKFFGFEFDNIIPRKTYITGVGIEPLPDDLHRPRKTKSSFVNLLAIPLLYTVHRYNFFV